MSTVQAPAVERALARASRLQRAIYALRSEGDTRARESAAVGTGLAIGCTPFWGTHFFVCWGAGWLLRLNRIKIYLAANLINPLILPFLLYAEVQAGAWIRRGEFRELSRSAFASVDPWRFGTDLVVGSVAVGIAMGLAGAAITYVLRRPVRDPFFRQLARRAADRYIDAGIIAWEFARGKLTGDPMYRHTLDTAFAGQRGTLVDLGCGQGLELALLAEAQALAARGAWPSGSPPPAFDRLIGIETRPRIAAIAARALDGEAEIHTGDIRDTGVPEADVVLLGDVLHMLPEAAQVEMLRAIRRALRPGGRLFMRDADADAGWRFLAVRVGNRLKALVTGKWRQVAAYRSADGWLRALAEAGFDGEVRPMGAGTPFGNVWIAATPRLDTQS